MSLLTPLPDDADPPCLFDDRYRTLFLADEARFADDEIVDDWPTWLRHDYRAFIADYLARHGVGYRELADAIRRSTGFISGFLKPKQTAAKFRFHCLHGADLETLLSHLALPEPEHRTLRALVYLEDARRRETGQGDIFRKQIDDAWRWETDNLAHDEGIRYARNYRAIIAREMSRLASFRSDSGWLRQHMLYPLDGETTEEEIGRAWETAVELRLVEQDERGRWRSGRSFNEAIIDTGTEQQQRAVKSLHQTIMEASVAALELPRERRHFVGRVIAIRHEALQDIRQAMHRLLSDLDEAPAGEAEAVVQVQLNAFAVADIDARPIRRAQRAPSARSTGREEES